MNPEIAKLFGIDAKDEKDAMLQSLGIPASASAKYLEAPTAAAAGDVKWGANDVIVKGPIIDDATKKMVEDIFGEGEVCFAPADIIAALKNKKKGDYVRLRVNSPGGMVHASSEICNYLVEAKGKGIKVDSVCDGMAASAASSIFLQGENRLVADLGQVMVHRSSVTMIFMGNAPDLQKLADSTIQRLDSLDNSIAEIMAKSADMNKNDAMDAMDKETWYGASAAIEAGLATGKFSENAEAEKDKPKMAGKPKNQFASNDIVSLMRRVDMYYGQ